MAFAIPSATSFALRRPVSPPAAWVRPADWPTITDDTNEVQFLINDTGIPATALTTTFTRGATGNIIIDWGDGTTDTVTTITSTTTNHTYTVGTGATCSQGYTTFKIRVYRDTTGVRITGCQVVANSTIQVAGWPSGVLEAYYGDTTVSSFQNYFSSGIMRFSQLQYVKLPQTVSGANALNGVFINCSGLTTVVMPTSASTLVTVQDTFSGCRSLLGPITIPQNATGITSLGACFANCNLLSAVNLPPSLNSLTNLQSAFANCFNLTSLLLPALPLCTNYQTAFIGCASLSSFQILGFTSTAQNIEMRQAFNFCYSLEQCLFPASVVAGTKFSMFQTFLGCSALKNFNFPTNSDVYAGSGGGMMISTFQTCPSLQSITLPASMPTLTSLSGTFNGCNNLQSITLPTTIGATVDMNSTFTGCTALSSITIPSSYNITSLASTFASCSMLNSIVLPNNAQNSCTTMASMCSSCTSLETIVMPTSLNLVNSLGATFYLCYNLESVVFPATMNAVTTAAQLCGANNSVGNLKSITLPTSMAACTSWDNSFVDQYQLQSVVFPANCPSVTTYLQCFVRSASITSVTLPTTTAPVTTVNRMFDGVLNLQTLNNEQFLGNGVTGATGTVTDGTTFFNTTTLQVTSLSFNTKFSKLSLAGSGTTATTRSKLNSLRLTNTGSGQWGGTSPQIDVSFTSMSTANLVTLFNDLAAQGTVVSKTINITSATGAAGLTAADRLIITSKGWTITG